MSDNDYGPLLKKVRCELEPEAAELQRVRAKIETTLQDHRQDKALLGNLPQADPETVGRVRDRIERGGRRGSLAWLWLAPVAAAALAFFLLDEEPAVEPQPEMVEHVATPPPGAPAVTPPEKSRGIAVQRVRGSGGFEDGDARAVVAQLQPAMKRCGPPARASVTIALGSGQAPGVVVSSPSAGAAAQRFESCLKKELAKVRLAEGELTAAPGQLPAAAFVRFEIETVDDQAK